jgi:hypothetical protein
MNARRMAQRVRNWWAERDRWSIWWTAKRPYCWLFGHERHALSGDGRSWANTHMCPRCLLFWREETTDGRG